MNYQPVTEGNQANPSAGNIDGDATFEVKEPEFEGRKPESEVYVSPSSSAKTKKHDDKTKREAKGKIPTVGKISTNNTNTFRAAGPSNTVVIPTLRESLYVDPSQYPDDPNMPALEDITYFDDEEDVGAEADLSNLETTITVSPIPTTRVHKDHPVKQIIGDLSLATQTRSMTMMVKDQGGLTQINNKDFHTCMFACFLSLEEPKRVHQALKDPSWIEAIQEELLQFKMQKVWVLVDLPNGKRAVGTKWVFRNKKDERGIVVRNKARLVAQGHTQEEGIDYEEVFAPVARIEAISPIPKTRVHKDHPVKQIIGDLSLATQTRSMTMMVKDQDLCKAFEKLMKDKFQMSSMGELTLFLGLQVKQKQDGIFISQDKYVAEILRKFGLNDGKSASTPIDTKSPLLKDHDGKDMEVHPYRSMIGSLIDYASASQDRKSTKRGYQFLGYRLISWQYKKKIVVATSSTEAEYVAACKVSTVGVKLNTAGYYG
nr:hypothetical protein [Tanacetum cinerariifolium]